jgi:hypothetical protein
MITPSTKHLRVLPLPLEKWREVPPSTARMRGPLRTKGTAIQSRRMLKKAVSKVAASEDRRRTLWGTLRI